MEEARKISVLIISYISKETEGRLSRHYTALNSNSNICCCLIQGVLREGEESQEENVINIPLWQLSPLNRFVDFYSKVRKHIKNNKYDYYFLQNYYTSVFSIFLDKKKIIYDAYELYYPGCGRKLSARDYFFYINERRCIRQSGLVIAANKERALVMTGHYRLLSIPIVITNDKYTMRANLPTKTNNNVVYVGDINEERGVFDLISAINRYNKRSNVETIKLEIYGKGNDTDKLEEICKNSEYVKYHGPYKNKDIDAILEEYKYGYIAYSNNELNTILCSPNKLSDYIRNGVVIIGNDNYNLKAFVDEHKVGSCDKDLYFALIEVLNNYTAYLNSEMLFIQEFTKKDEYGQIFAFMKTEQGEA